MNTKEEMKMKCKDCGSTNIEVLDVYDRDVYTNAGRLIDRGNAVCNDCDCEFDFVNTYKIELTKSKTY